MGHLYNVWTRSENPEWLKKNNGNPMALLVLGVPDHTAVEIVKTLKLVYGDDNVFAESYPVPAGGEKA